MAPVASNAPTSSTGASSRPSPVALTAGVPSWRPSHAGAARAGQAERDDGRAHDAGDERQPDPDRPEMGVDHQQAVAGGRVDPPRVLRDVGRGVLHLDRVGQELARRVRAKWPTTTTGMSFWNSCGGLPLFTTSTTLAPWRHREVSPGGGRADRAGHDVALEPEGRRAELGPMRERLVDRVEVVERAPEALDEQEDQRAAEQDEHEQEPPLGAPAADGQRRRHGGSLRRLGRRGRARLGGGVGHGRSAGSSPRRGRTPSPSTRAPSAGVAGTALSA